MSVRGHDFKPIDPKDIPARTSGHRPSRYAATLGEFMRSGALAVEVDAPRSSSASHCLGKCIKDAGLHGKVECFVRKGRVFLVRVTS